MSGLWWLLPVAYGLVAALSRRHLMVLMAEDLERIAPLDRTDYAFVRWMSLVAAVAWPLFWWPLDLLDLRQSRSDRSRRIVERTRGRAA